MPPRAISPYPTLGARHLVPWPGGTAVFPFDGRARVRRYRFARAAVTRGLRALGIGPGDDVLVPAFHHGVEVEAVRATGARPLPYPIGADLCLRVSEVERRVTETTRAVYATHYFGFPQPAAALRALCDRRGLVLLEDCALALGSADGGRPLGTLGDLAVFCLYKTLPVPDGGLLVVRDGRPAPPDLGLLARARSLRPRPDARERAGHPDFHPVQLDRAMSPLTRLALRGFDLAAIRRRRRDHYRFWAEALGARAEAVRPELPAGACPLFYPVLVDSKPRLCAALRAEGIELANWWPAARGGIPAPDPVADRLRARLVGLPVHQELAPADLERVRQALGRFL